VLFPVRSAIGGPFGIGYWIVLTLVASALPVRLPKGIHASVSFAPIIASVVLGGPVAAGIVAFVGTTEDREVRGAIPWYGTLFNHASLMTAAVAAGIVFDSTLVAVGDSHDAAGAVIAFAGLLAGGVVYYFVSSALAVAAVSLREGVSARTVWAKDIRANRPEPHWVGPFGLANGSDFYASERGRMVGNSTLRGPTCHHASGVSEICRDARAVRADDQGAFEGG